MRMMIPQSVAVLGLAIAALLVAPAASERHHPYNQGRRLHHHHRRHHDPSRELEELAEGEYLRGSRVPEPDVLDDRRTALATAQSMLRSEVLDDQALGDAGATVDVATPYPTASSGLPSADKSNGEVRRELVSMDADMKKLSDKKQAAEKSREAVSDTLADAQGRMVVGQKIQHDVRRTEATIRKDERNLDKLKAEDSRLETTQANLRKMLHTVMDPKIRAKQRRLAREELLLKHVQANLDAWTEEQNVTKARAVAQLSERKKKLKELHEAEVALAEATRMHEQTEKAYRAAKFAASHDVEAYRIAESRFEGEETKAAEQLGETRAQERSLKRIQHIMQVEQERIDGAMTFSKSRLEKKEKREFGKLESDGKMLKQLNLNLQHWQDQERERLQEAARRRLAYETAQQEFDRGRQDVVDTANHKAGRRAEENSDWAWSGDWATPSSSADEVRLSAL